MGTNLEFHEHEQVRKVTLFNVCAPREGGSAEAETQSFNNKLSQA
jgi:hypothetical protein